MVLHFTDYPDDIYAGDLAGDTSLVSVNLNPNIAYRINDSFSVGAGVNFVMQKLSLQGIKVVLLPVVHLAINSFL